MAVAVVLVLAVVASLAWAASRRDGATDTVEITVPGGASATVDPGGATAVLHTLERAIAGDDVTSAAALGASPAATDLLGAVATNAGRARIDDVSLRYVDETRHDHDRRVVGRGGRRAVALHRLRRSSCAHGGRRPLRDRRRPRPDRRHRGRHPAHPGLDDRSAVGLAHRRHPRAGRRAARRGGLRRPGRAGGGCGVPCRDRLERASGGRGAAPALPRWSEPSTSSPATTSRSPPSRARPTDRWPTTRPCTCT